jgi:mono/diheme cytochrome c family protein
MGRGPELTRLAQDPAHTADWIATHIRNPKSHKPQSRMPGFGPDRINDDDLKALAEYLANLK